MRDKQANAPDMQAADREATIAARLARARAAVRRAAAARGGGEARILAVSKGRPVEDIVAARAAGQTRFGESRAQEARDKIEQLAGRCAELEWHFIGPIQRNKTRHIAELFDWAHSLDRLAVAERLSRQRPPGRPPLSVCLQVNIDAVPERAGVAPDEAGALLARLADLPGLRVRGLMAIPVPHPDPAAQRETFDRMRALFDAHAAARGLDTLSLGMSADFEAAIAAGATVVRLGRCLFDEGEFLPNI